MSMTSNRTRLMTVSRELSAQWVQTKACWRDARCAEFEREYMDELQSSVDTAVQVIEQLDKLVSRIRSDCE